MYFSKNYPQFGHTPSKRFASPVMGQKILNNISLRGGLPEERLRMMKARCRMTSHPASMLLEAWTGQLLSSATTGLSALRVVSRQSL